MTRANGFTQNTEIWETCYRPGAECKKCESRVEQLILECGYTRAYTNIVRCPECEREGSVMVYEDGFKIEWDNQEEDGDEEE